MKTITTIKSRYKEDRVLKKISDNEYLISGKSLYMRYDHPTVPTFIDFDGGPYISIDMNLQQLFGINKTVTKIIPDKKGYILITK